MSDPLENIREATENLGKATRNLKWAAFFGVLAIINMLIVIIHCLAAH